MIVHLPLRQSQTLGDKGLGHSVYSAWSSWIAHADTQDKSGDKGASVHLLNARPLSPARCPIQQPSSVWINLFLSLLHGSGFCCLTTFQACSGVHTGHSCISNLISSLTTTVSYWMQHQTLHSLLASVVSTPSSTHGFIFNLRPT